MHRCLPQTPAAAPGLRFVFTVSSGSAHLPAKQICTFTHTVIISLPCSVPSQESPQSYLPECNVYPLSKPRSHHTPGPLCCQYPASFLPWCGKSCSLFSSSRGGLLLGHPPPPQGSATQKAAGTNAGNHRHPGRDQGDTRGGSELGPVMNLLEIWALLSSPPPRGLPPSSLTAPTSREEPSSSTWVKHGEQAWVTSCFNVSAFPLHWKAFGWNLSSHSCHHSLLLNAHTFSYSYGYSSLKSLMILITIP